VIPDFRPPDGIRIGLSPLSTSFAELERGVEAIARELRDHAAARLLRALTPRADRRAWTPVLPAVRRSCRR